MLGLAASLSALVAAVLSILVGHIGDKTNPGIMIRISYVLFIISIIVLRLSRSLAHVFISFAITSLTLTIFWPVIQGAMGKESQKGKESKDVADFSTSWSTGKSIGFFASGYCYSFLGLGNSLTMLIFLSGLLLLIYPYSKPEEAVRDSVQEMDQRNLLSEDKDFEPLPSAKIELEALEDIAAEREEEQSRVNDVLEKSHIETTSDAPQRPMFVRRNSTSSSRSNSSGTSESSFIEISGSKVPRDPMMSFNNSLNLPLSWIFNFVVYGMANTVASLYVKVIMHYNIEIKGLVDSNSFLGVWNCCYYVVQTLCFIFNSKHISIWEYNRKALYFVESIQVVGLFCLGMVHNPYILLIVGGAMGSGVGLSDLCALTYSLRATDTDKSKYAGINETTINAGSFLFPIILGFISDYSYVIPYIILSGVVLLCIVLQEIVYRVRFNGARKKYLEEPYALLATEHGDPRQDVTTLTEQELADGIKAMLDGRTLQTEKEKIKTPETITLENAYSADSEESDTLSERSS